MKVALMALLSILAPHPATASDRDPKAISAYQAETLKTAGIAPPPADALAIAALLVDRKLQAEEAAKPASDQIFERWTSNIFVSKDYGMPCDVANAACAASARAAARSLAPLLMSKVRDLAVLVAAFDLSSRFSLPELTIVKAFVSTSAGAKLEPEAFTGHPVRDDPRWKGIGADIEALSDKYRRQFINETRALPRAKPPEPPRAPKAKP